jgi:hypothetical protein
VQTEDLSLLTRNRHWFHFETKEAVPLQTVSDFLPAFYNFTFLRPALGCCLFHSYFPTKPFYTPVVILIGASRPGYFTLLHILRYMRVCG